MNRKLHLGRRMLLGSTGSVLVLMIGLVSPLPGRTESQAGAAQPPATAAAPQSFEVASIKPSAGDGRSVRIGISPGGRYNASGVSVKLLIQQAYDVRDFQISGGPSWLSSERYDIVAKAETPNLTREQVRVLLQSLLAERFQLRLHRESKEMPVYALVVGKNGHKLHKSEIQPGSEAKTPPDAAPASGPGALARGAAGPRMSNAAPAGPRSGWAGGSSTPRWLPFPPSPRC